MRKVLAAAAVAAAVMGFASAASAANVYLGCDTFGRAFIANAAGVAPAGACNGGQWFVRLGFTSLPASSSNPLAGRARTVLLGLTHSAGPVAKMEPRFQTAFAAARANPSTPTVPISTQGLPAYVLATYAPPPPTSAGGAR